jgi:hypothetical protein
VAVARGVKGVGFFPSVSTFLFPLFFLLSLVCSPTGAAEEAAAAREHATSVVETVNIVYIYVSPLKKLRQLFCGNRSPCGVCVCVRVFLFWLVFFISFRVFLFLWSFWEVIWLWWSLVRFIF